MAAIVSLIVIAMVSLLAVRAGTTALMMTGLSWDTASFQSYSAFFGVGFTTREAEMVVNHPVRRRIIRDLILAGNIGVTEFERIPPVTDCWWARLRALFAFVPNPSRLGSARHRQDDSADS